MVSILFSNTMLTLPLSLWVLGLKSPVWQGYRACQHPLPGGGKRQVISSSFFQFPYVFLFMFVNMLYILIFISIVLQFEVASRITVSVLYILSLVLFYPLKSFLPSSLTDCGRVVYSLGIVLYPCSQDPVPVTFPHCSSSAITLCLCSSRKSLCAGVIDTSLLMNKFFLLLLITEIYIVIKAMSHTCTMLNK